MYMYFISLFLSMAIAPRVARGNGSYDRKLCDKGSRKNVGGGTKHIVFSSKSITTVELLLSKALNL